MDRKLSSAPLSAAGPSPQWRKKKHRSGKRRAGCMCVCVCALEGERQRKKWNAHNGTFYAIIYIYIYIQSYCIYRTRNRERFQSMARRRWRERGIKTVRSQSKKSIRTSAVVIPMHLLCILFIRNNNIFFVRFFLLFFIPRSKFWSFRPETPRRQYCLAGRVARRTSNTMLRVTTKI